MDPYWGVEFYEKRRSNPRSTNLRLHCSKHLFFPTGRPHHHCMTLMGLHHVHLRSLPKTEKGEDKSIRSIMQTISCHKLMLLFKTMDTSMLLQEDSGLSTRFRHHWENDNSTLIITMAKTSYFLFRPNKKIGGGTTDSKFFTPSK
jgi:hypothetical protein